MHFWGGILRKSFFVWTILSKISSRKKKIKQNRTIAENFDICFFVILIAILKNSTLDGRYTFRLNPNTIIVYLLTVDQKSFYIAYKRS